MAALADSRSMSRFRLALVALAVGGAFAAGTVVHGASAPTRVDLAMLDDPVGAPGKALALTKVVVPAGASLATHYHPGSGVASIDSGSLTYTVVRGSVNVWRGSPPDASTLERTVRAGHTTTLRAGEWIAEAPGMIHRARNATDRSIVIHLATLYPIGAPPATAVAK